MKRTMFCLLAVLSLIVLVQPVHAQTPSPAPLPDRDVRIPAGAQPKMSAAAFANVLQTAGSDAAAEAQAMYSAIVEFGIEPSFFLAVFKHESTYGTASNWAGRKPDGMTTHNPGNIVCGGGWPCYGRFRDYPSWTTGTRDWAGLLETYYFSRGLTTVEKIINVYAPPSDNNDTPAYIQQVLRDMAQWEGQTVATPPVPTQPNFWSSDYWVQAPGEGLLYYLMQLGSAIAWQVDKAVFLGHEALGQAHESFVDGFASVLDVVGAAFSPALRGISLLALTIAALLLFLSPVFIQNIVSMRRGLIALALVPAVMTAAGSGFVLVEELRQAFGETLGTAAGGRAAMIFSLRSDNNFPGTSAMGQVQKYYANAPIIGVIDMAAAYMFANYQIVHGDADLPPDFYQTFFKANEYFAAHPDAKSWSDVPQADRDRLNAGAQRGLTRAVTAFGVSLPALLERIVNLLLTINTAIVFLSLMLIIPFLALDSYAALALDLWRQLPQLVVVSGLIAILESIISAFLLITARSGNAWIVFIATALYGLFLFLAAGVLAFQALRGLVALASTALTGGLGAAQDVGRVAIGAVGGAVAGTIAGGRALQRLDVAAKERARLPRLPDSAKNMVSSFHAAESAGHNRNFAAGYAVSGSRLGRGAARIALASGVIGGPNAPEIERGLRTGVIAGQSEPMSLESLLKMRQAPKRPARRVSPGQTAGSRYIKDVTPQLTQGPLITPPPVANSPAQPTPAAQGESKT